MSRARSGRPAPAQRALSPQVTLSEEDGVRYLHFGSVWVQGAMRIRQPDRLVLEYQQQMMAALLFLPQPQRILQLGLGAAALTKFCYRNLPQADIAVVEISDAVVAAARQYFRLPPDDERMTVLIEDARSAVAHPRRRHSVDWLQVDLYDRAARGPVCDDEDFYRACRRVLRAPGVAVFNLFGRGLEASFTRIAAAFADRAVVLPEADAGNRIVLVFVGPPLQLQWSALYAQAQQVEQAFGLPARKWVSGLRAQAEGGTEFLI